MAILARREKEETEMLTARVRATTAQMARRYSEWCNRPVSEVVDLLLVHTMERDKDFLKWLGENPAQVVRKAKGKGAHG